MHQQYQTGNRVLLLLLLIERQQRVCLHVLLLVRECLHLNERLELLIEQFFYLDTCCLEIKLIFLIDDSLRKVMINFGHDSVQVLLDVLPHYRGQFIPQPHLITVKLSGKPIPRQLLVHIFEAICVVLPRLRFNLEHVEPTVEPERDGVLHFHGRAEPVHLLANPVKVAEEAVVSKDKLSGELAVSVDQRIEELKQVVG